MFSNAVRIFTINSFDIKVDPSWLLIAALITWSLSQQYFPAVFPDQTRQTYVLMAVFAMLLFFASLLLHELSHSVVARQFGVPINAITLFLFGGVAELEAEPKTAMAEFWIAVAGPVMSIALALGFWVVSGVSALVGAPEPVTQVLSYLAMINLVLAIFNLVPAFPLDGGRILRAYLWHRSGDILRATEAAARSGAVFGYLLIGLGVLFLFQGAQAGGLWQILIGVFILMAARGSYQNQLALSAVQGKVVADLMSSDPVVAAPDMTLAELVNRVLLRHRVSFVPVVEDGVLLGHIDSDVLRRIDRENWASTRVGDVFAGLDDTATVRPDLPLKRFISGISKSGQRKFLVTRNRALLGVITLADLTRYLSVADLRRNPTIRRSDA